MDLKIYGEDIFNITNEVAYLQLQATELERQISETELGKKLKDIKDKIIDYKNKEEEFKKAMYEGMINSGTEKIEMEHQIFTIKKNPPAVNILDENLIPDEYKKIKVDFDKTKIKNAIKEGKIIEGVEITQGTSLLITAK